MITPSWDHEEAKIQALSNDMPDRIDMIQKMLAKSPDDLFLTYSLGMELAGANRPEEALARFARCRELDANYLPAYSEGGKALRALGRLAEARELFAAGMKLASQQGQSHTRDYLQEQLEGLGK